MPETSPQALPGGRGLLPRRGVHAFIALAALLFAVLPFWHHGIETLRFVLLGLGGLAIALRPSLLRDFRRFPPFWLLALFLIVAGISLLANGYSLSPLGRAANWIACVVIGGLLANLGRDKLPRLLAVSPASLPLAMLATAGTCLLLGLPLADYGLGEYDTRLTFLSDVPTRLSLLTGSFAVLCAVFSLNATDRFSRRAWAVLALVNFGLTILTGSRGPLLAFLAVFTLAVLIRFRHRVRAILMYALILAAALFAFSRADFDSPILARLQQAVTAPQDSEYVAERLLIWHVGWKAFTGQPLTGVGFDRYTRWYEADLAANKDTYAERFPFLLHSDVNAHNFALHFLAETGLPGFLCMFGLWAWAVVAGFRRGGTGLGVSAVFVFSFLCFNANMNLYAREISTYLFLLMGTLMAPAEGVDV